MTSPQPPICDYEGSDYQTSFWEHGGRDYEDRTEAIALQRLLPTDGDLLLELGAGAGRNSPRYTGFRQVVLLDYSLTQLQQALRRLGLNQRYIYVAADIYRMPFVEGLFDAATMIRTLHHMADPKLALEQVHRTMQPGAPFILEYANKRNMKAILRYLLGRQSWSPFSMDSVEFEKLNFDFHPKAVRRWLAESGFSLEQQLAVSYFRLGMLKRIVPVNLLARLDSWFQPTGRWFQYSPSIFTRSHTVGNTPKAQPGTFFRCPACESTNLEHLESAFICHKCAKEWPIRDGVYDFRLMTG